MNRWWMFSGVLSAEQGERYRVDAGRFAVGLRGADRSAAVAAVHLECGELVAQLRDLPLAVGGDERALLLRPFPDLLRNVLGAYIRVFLDKGRIDLAVRQGVRRAVAAHIGVVSGKTLRRRLDQLVERQLMDLAVRLDRIGRLGGLHRRFRRRERVERHGVFRVTVVRFLHLLFPPSGSVAACGARAAGRVCRVPDNRARSRDKRAGRR